MLTVSDRIQIPSKTTHKDTGTKVNEHYYFISKYSLNTSNFFLLANLINTGSYSVRAPCGICEQLTLA